MPNKPAEPSPEVAPKQTCDWCNGTGISKPVYGGGLVATGLSCPRGCPVPAVAPRDLSCAVKSAVSGEQYCDRHSRPATAESQGVERAQPVEGPRETCKWSSGLTQDDKWCMTHRSYLCKPAAPVEGVERVTDDAPARVEPTCSCLRFSERVKGTGIWADYCATCGKKRPPMQQKRPCGCIGPNEACDECATQPAKHTDNRPAETIPDLEFDRHRDKLTPYWQKKVRDFRVEIAEQDDELAAAETRIEVLEAALRFGKEVFEAMLSDFNECKEPKMVPGLVRMAIQKTDAALGAPSGEKV